MLSPTAPLLDSQRAALAWKRTIWDFKQLALDLNFQGSSSQVPLKCQLLLTFLQFSVIWHDEALFWVATHLQRLLLPHNSAKAPSRPLKPRQADGNQQACLYRTPAVPFSWVPVSQHESWEHLYSLWQLVPSLSQNSRRVVESHGNGARHGRVSWWHVMTCDDCYA